MGGALNRLRWRLAGRLYGAIDRLYRRGYRLERVGKLLWVRLDVWRGAPRRLGDGTEVGIGDQILRLHLDNQLIAAESGSAETPAASGLRFARRFFPAYRALARRVSEDADWGRAVAVHHIGWIPPHGERFGFEFERLPDGWRARWIRWHMTNLMMVANPEAGRRERQRLWPMEIWLSRGRLIASFLEEPLPW